MKKLFLTGLAVLIAFALAGCMEEGYERATLGPENSFAREMETAEAPATKPALEQANTIVYQNTDYGFEFTLPASWKGYKIVTDKWEGVAPGGQEGQQPAATGPMISIRHPKWTKKKPRQDIPIMVFTLKQWEDLQAEKFHIGAAPIGPKELGRNDRYVFALPARYNFAFPEGYKEVETILAGKPLSTPT